MLTNLPRFAAVTVALAMSLTTSTVSAVPPRSERVANRIVERAYARQSIAEARAAQAEARVAQISPLAPVPPPPRPATVRRMRRAGVPLTPPPVTQSAAIMAAPARRLAPALPPASKPAAPPPVADELVLPAVPTNTNGPAIASPAAPSDDGTKSVLATAEGPVTATPIRTPAGAPVTHPPIELLPTP
jgi:hypothetical protein